MDPNLHIIHIPSLNAREPIAVEPITLWNVDFGFWRCWFIKYSDLCYAFLYFSFRTRLRLHLIGQES